MKKIHLTNARELLLAMALFFNPLGYNELFAATMTITHSYWLTAATFYGFAITFFIAYLVLKVKSKKAECKNGGDV